MKVPEGHVSLSVQLSEEKINHIIIFSEWEQ